MSTLLANTYCRVRSMDRVVARHSPPFDVRDHSYPHSTLSLTLCNPFQLQFQWSLICHLRLIFLISHVRLYS